MNKDCFSTIRRQRRAFLAEQNRDERHNELVALKIMTESLCRAAIYEPEDWEFYENAQKRILTLRRFLNPMPKP